MFGSCCPEEDHGPRKDSNPPLQEKVIRSLFRNSLLFYLKLKEESRDSYPMSCSTTVWR